MATTAVRRLDFRLTKPQSKAFKAVRDPRSDLNLEWGRGCGKSWMDRFIAWSWIAQADGVPRLELLRQLGVLDELDEEQKQKAAGVKGIRVVFLLPTRKQFVDIHGRLLRQENDDTWSHLRGKLNGTTYQVDFNGGSFIAPFPASEHGSKRALGLRCDVVIADEADDIDIDVFDTVVRPWFSEPWSLKIRVTSGTPRRGRHGLLWQRHLAGLDAEQPRYRTIHATYRDNPEIVDRKEVDDARRNTPKATFEREWECNYDSGEGLVYSMFDEAFHVREPPADLRFQEFHVGMDHGDVDPGVLLLAGIQGHGEDATVWFLDEWYETGVLNSVWNERAAQWRHARFWPDPSRSDRIRELKAIGLDVGPTDNSILPGIGRVAELLFIRTVETGERFARMYISPKCVNMIRELGLYRRMKHADGSYDEKPEDESNHCLVAGTQVLTSRGEVAIEDVVAGDRVLTGSGWDPVRWSGQTFASAPIWRLETSHGTIEGTPDHRVWTANRSWVRLDALRYGDILSVWENTDAQSACDSTALCSGDTRILATQTSRFTIAPAHLGVEQEITCTGLSGHSITDRSQKPITFTTKTRTRSTTRSAILSACLTLSIFRFTAVRAPQSNLSVSERMSRALGRLPRLGMQARRGAPGMLSTRAMLSQSGSRLPQPAHSAGIRSKRWAGERQIDSARTTASHPGAERLASTTNGVLAPSAAATLRPTATPKYRLVHAIALRSFSAERSAPVYDLTVSGKHEFFANGILVHNSMDAARYLCMGRFGKPANTRNVVSGR